MKKRNLFLIGITTALLLTGCQTNTGSEENEALRQQITQLEQQVTTLEQQVSTTADTSEETENGHAAEENADETAQVQASPADSNISDQENLTTTQTIEELTNLVEAYEEKVKASVPTGTAADDMEQFFTLKQEEDQIDNALDLHEDELEFLYRNDVLTRDEYKTQERTLEALEDRLDDAEDRLEIIFGIDD